MKTVRIKKQTAQDIIVYAQGEVYVISDVDKSIMVSPPCVVVVEHPWAEIGSSTMPMVGSIGNETIFKATGDGSIVIRELR